VKLTRPFRHATDLSVICLGLALAGVSLLQPISSTALRNVGGNDNANAHAANPDDSVKKPAMPIVRWDETTPGCTFSRSTDGRYHYGLWSDDAAVTLAVDSQELEKVRRRHELFFSVTLTVKYRGAAAIDVSPGSVSLEFVKHFKVVQTSLDPDGFSQKVQNDADEFDHQTAREVQKHPEQKDAKQAHVRAFQKDTAELLEFLSKSTLKPAHLDSGNREVSGWILFSTDSKWIGAWKKQEEFILRVPLGGKVFEFPFRLPPAKGELLLRQRE
jgi:hypothetical protein